MNEQHMWVWAFTTIYGWQFHPGATRDGFRQLSMEDCAQLADLALAQFKRRYPWPIGQQSEP